MEKVWRYVGFGLIVFLAAYGLNILWSMATADQAVEVILRASKDKYSVGEDIVITAYVRSHTFRPLHVGHVPGKAVPLEIYKVGTGNVAMVSPPGNSDTFVFLKGETSLLLPYLWLLKGRLHTFKLYEPGIYEVRGRVSLSQLIGDRRWEADRSIQFQVVEED